MSKSLVLALLSTVLALFGLFHPLWLAPAVAANETIVQVNLGDKAGTLAFFPNHLEFIPGHLYKLILNNPSPLKHYFTAKDFADASWTKKVEVADVEIKGAVHELELKPGAGPAEWVFVPLKSGTYELRCTIAGHGEAGMTGTLTIAEGGPLG